MSLFDTHLGSIAKNRYKLSYVFNSCCALQVQIACPSISPHEFHPFSLSSAPNEKHLMLHIRAVGLWTRKLQKICNPRHLTPYTGFPKVQYKFKYLIHFCRALYFVAMKQS